MELSSVCRDNGKTVSLTDSAWEYTKGEFVTCSKWMLEQIATLEDVAGTDLRVLICGGQGTRKQRYAEYLHGLSRRSDRPYARFDCSATHVSQYGRELMGSPGRKGIIEQCAGGTLLLDGAGDIPEAYHSAIELLLENGTVIRPDGTEAEVDVRLLATTDAEALSSGGASRLLQRLGAVHIEIPPLCRRPEDIALQSLYHMWRVSSRYGSIKRMGSGLFRAILDYPWPGNERELENFIEQVVLMEPDSVVDDAGLIHGTGHLSASVTRRQHTSRQEGTPGRSLKDMVSEYELMLIQQSIRQHGSLRKAAQALQIAPSALSRKLSAAGKKVKDEA